MGKGANHREQISPDGQASILPRPNQKEAFIDEQMLLGMDKTQTLFDLEFLPPSVSLG